MDWKTTSIHCFVSHNDGSGVQTNASTSTDAKENRVLNLGMPHQLDQFMKQNGQGRHAHTVRYRQNWTNFEHCIPKCVESRNHINECRILVSFHLHLLGLSPRSHKEIKALCNTCHKLGTINNINKLVAID